MALQLRSRCRKTLQNPSIPRFFSSSSSSSSNGGEDDKTSPSPSSSYLSSIKSSLHHSSPPPPRSRNPNSPPPYPPPQPSRIASVEEIRKNLSEFRLRSAAPSSPDGRDAPSRSSLSFQDVYKRNVIGQGNADGSVDIKKSLDSIRESLGRIRASSPAAGLDQRGQRDNRPDPLSLAALKDTLKQKAHEDSASSRDSLRNSLFGRETAEAKTEADSQAASTDFVKTYNYQQLGKKLKQLRPPEAAGKKKDWFSLGELNERLMKLRKIDEEESRGQPPWYMALRDSMVKIQNANDASAKKQSSRLSP